MKIVFLHPDLGIGGAERLVVDAALALKSAGHSVQFIVNHHDENHCFHETKDGSLKVTVVGQSIPRNILGRFVAFFAYIRMIYAAYFLVKKSGIDPDVVICDQISACIPVLRYHRAKIIFYCHFPDQLLSKHNTILKKIYRAPIDWFEEKTTGMADVVLVNSQFTASVFRKTFKRLAGVPIRVLYPTLNFTAFDKPLKGDFSKFNLKSVGTVFLSINRYERKKNLELAIKALEKMFSNLGSDQQKNIHLIIAGGYDSRIPENIEYHQELTLLCEELCMNDHVTFLKSPSDSDKHLLLHSCTAVIYTPENEHFGIVPLEAMYMVRPVIAANSGGPTETVIDSETGFLCEPTAESFATAMKKFVSDRSLAREMGATGQERVKSKFSFQTFKKNLNKIVINLASNETNPVNKSTINKKD